MEGRKDEDENRANLWSYIAMTPRQTPVQFKSTEEATKLARNASPVFITGRDKSSR